MTSFYGGRAGVPFRIVKRFDGIDIPQVAGSYVYKKRLCAIQVIDDTTYFIYPWIEQTGNNYKDKDYSWSILTFDGKAKNIVTSDGVTGTRAAEEEYAEGMRQCFEKGGESTDEVNYGEYVIIDTIINLNEYSNPDNGKVFRRGMNFDYDAGTNPYAGGEYVGQIVGPKGNIPKLSMGTVEYIESEGGLPYSYDMSNGGIAPGKSETGEFNDAITYSWTNFADPDGNITDTVFGFTFPYLVAEFSSNQRSAYYEAGDEIPEGKIEGDRLPANFEFIERTDDKSHPYYEKWQVKVPNGIKGESAVDIEVYPTYAKAETEVYYDSALTQLAGPANGSEEIKTEAFNKDLDYIELEDGRFISSLGGDVFRIRYKEYSYENKASGEYNFIDIGEYNMVERVALSADGILTIYYTYQDEDVLEEKLNWIYLDDQASAQEQGIYVNDEGTITIFYNTLNELNQHNTQVQSKALPWVTSVSLGEDGLFKVIYNNDSDRIIDIDESEGHNFYIDDNGHRVYEAQLPVITNVRVNTDKHGAGAEGEGTQKLEIKFNTEDDYQEIGEPINYILDSYVVPMSSDQVNLRGHLLIYYSDPKRRAASAINNLTFPSGRLQEEVSGWTDMGSVKGEKGNLNIVGIYDSLDQAPGSPENIMGGDNNYAGWNILFGDTSDPNTSYHIGVYDYVTNQWEDGGLYTSDPTQIIATDENDGRVSSGGFVINRAVVRTNAEDGEDNNVVTKILQKKDEGFDEFSVGPEVRYVGAQVNSNNNNLEEQLILGTDNDESITREIIEENGEQIVKITESLQLKVSGSTNDYYVVDKVIKEELNSAYDSENSKLIINLNPKVISKKETLSYYHNDNKKKISTKTVTYNYDGSNVTTETNIVQE